jgi:Na+-driven multidrug efflux pump
MTSLIFLLVQPIGSAALSRMPRPLESLAAWPVVSGLLFLLRSMGVAFNEVVIARLDEAGAAKTLRRFALILGMTTTVLLIAFAATPLAEFWFEDLSALPADLAAIASRALWFALPLPALSVFQSWFQGVIMQTRRTRAITEAVTIGLITISTVLGIGVFMGSFLGLYVGWAAFSLGTSVQVGWLWWRSRPALRELAAG